MIDRTKPYGEVIAEQQAEHGRRVKARQAINGQPMRSEFDELAAELNGRLNHPNGNWG